MNSPLVDPEGFPRADIDVYTVRLARAAIVRLRNDHRAVVEEMGRVLQVVYAPQDSQRLVNETRTSGSNGTNGTVNGSSTIQPPLAKVNSVAPGSPAAQAVGRHISIGTRDVSSTSTPRVLKRTTLSSSLATSTATIRSLMSDSWSQDPRV